MTTFDAHNVRLAFANASPGDRSQLGTCYDVYLAIDHYIYLSNMIFQYSFNGYPDPDGAEKVARQFANGWKLAPANVTVGGTLVVRWNVQVSSIAIMRQEILLGNLNFCMPYGDLVNWKASAVIIPPPC